MREENHLPSYLNSRFVRSTSHPRCLSPPGLLHVVLVANLYKPSFSHWHPRKGDTPKGYVCSLHSCSTSDAPLFFSLKERGITCHGQIDPRLSGNEFSRGERLEMFVCLFRRYWEIHDIQD